MHKNIIVMSTSIATPNTSDTVSANIISMPFTKVDNALPKKFDTAKGLISNEAIKEYIEQSQRDKLDTTMLNSDKAYGINLWQYANKLYEISQKYKNDNTTTEYTIKTIDSCMKEITDILKQSQTRYENVFQNDKLYDMDIRITKEFFSNSKEQVDKLLNSGIPKIYRQAYIKVHSYIDNIQTQNTHTTQQAQINFQNLINKKFTQTKLKYQNLQNNTAYQHIGETTNSQRDFTIQLKRIAEYSYRVYKGESVLKVKDKFSEENTNQPTRVSILSNFIYNESFIPTKIDMHKDL